MGHWSELIGRSWRRSWRGSGAPCRTSAPGLTAEQLALRALPPSNLSLLGLVRHLAEVERTWFRQRATGAPMTWIPSSPGDFARFREECRLADAAAAAMAFDDTFIANEETYSLRPVYVHMIAEYARYSGHADLLREVLDGTTWR